MQVNEEGKPIHLVRCAMNELEIHPYAQLRRKRYADSRPRPEEVSQSSRRNQ